MLQWSIEVCFLHIVLMKYFEFYWTIGFRIYMTLVLVIAARLFHTVLYTHGILFEKCQHSTYILFNLDLAIAPELTRGSSGIMDNVCHYWLWRKGLWPQLRGIDPRKLAFDISIWYIATYHTYRTVEVQSMINITVVKMILHIMKRKKPKKPDVINLTHPWFEKLL